MNEIRMWRENIDARIPVICCSSGEAGPKRLVILYHAFLECKEFMLPFAYKLAGMGYLAVAVDLQLHGERADYSGKFPWVEFYRVVFRTSDEISRLIDYFEENRHIVKDRAAVLGVSLGGLTAFSSAIKDTRIKAVASLLASANYPRLARVRSGGELRRFFSDNTYDAAAFYEEVDRLSLLHDAYFNLEKLSGKDIFMANGGVDMAIPISVVEDFQQRLSEMHGEKPEAFRFHSVPGSGHHLNRSMYEMAIAWLGRDTEARRL